MTDVITFTNPEFGRVRTIDIDAVTWFVGKDVADSLGYSNSSKAVSTHVDDEDKTTMMLPTSQNGQTVGKMYIINESGLYSLILSSKLPNAKKFKRWITSEVLPTIRRTGAYRSGNEPERLAEPQRALTVDDYIRAAQILAGCKNERLPYVTALLGKAGIDTMNGGNLMECIAAPAGYDRERGLKAAKLIKEAIDKYGWTAAAIGELVGVHRVVIHRYRNGQSIPREPRASFIISALLTAIPALAERYADEETDLE